MTTFTLNLAGVSDADPYTLPAGWTARSGSFKVVSNAIKSRWNDGNPSIATIDTPNVSGVLDVTVTLNYASSHYNDSSVVAFVTNSGNGYIVRTSGDEVFIAAVSAGIEGARQNLTNGSNTSTGNTFAVNATFRATFDIATGVLKVFLNGSSTPLIQANGLSYSSGMSAGFYSNWDNSGGGSIKSIVVDTGVALPTITVLPATLNAGSSNAFTKVNMGTITSATFGTVTCAIVSGELVIPDWVDGVVQPLDVGHTYTVTMSDGTVSATRSAIYGAKTGYTNHQLGAGMTVVTTNDSICSDPALIAGTEVFTPDLAGGLLYNSGELEDLPFGKYLNLWHHDLSYVMHSFTMYAFPSVTAFTLTDVTGQVVNTDIISNVITIATGAAGAIVPVSITGGTYAVSTDGGSTYGSYISTPSDLVSGNKIKVKVHSSSSASTPVSGVLTIGDQSDTFTVTTAGGVDTTPDAFTFIDITGAAFNAQLESNAITVAGVTAATNVAISISGAGAMYAVSTNGGTSYSAYTNAAGNVQLGNLVKVRNTSSPSNTTAVNSVLTIGGVSDTFTITTGPVTDTTPAQFTFVDVTNVALGSTNTSNTITVAGINAPSSISIVGGVYSINGAPYTAAPGTVTNGQDVNVRVVAAGVNSTPATATLTIGGISDDYTVTTISGVVDIIPNAFSFTDVTGQLPADGVISSTVTISGINSPSPITVTGGQYAIDTGSGFGDFTSAAGTVNNGDKVRLLQTTSSSYSTAANTVLTVGGISDTFTTTTKARPVTVLTVNSGKIVSWVCAGTSDPLTIPVLPGQGDKGIQLESAGLDFTGAVVTMYGITGATRVQAIPASPGGLLLIGLAGLQLRKVVITNIAAGTYPMSAYAVV